MPRVSVIIPTHGRPRLLPRAVESARRGGEDVEVIVVDDASTDETAEVCRGLEGVRHVRLERNQGVAGARNVGLLASSAEYVAFLDDDDRRLPGSLDYQLASLEARPGAGFVCGPVLLAGRDGSLTGEVASPPRCPGGEVFWRLLEWDFFVLPVAALVRKSALSRVGLLRSDLSRIDDWDLWVRLAELHEVATVARPVGIYTVPPLVAEGEKVSHYAPDFLRAARHQRELFRLPRVQAAPAARRRAVRRRTLNRLADVLFHQSATHLSQGACRLAWKNLLAGLRLSPRRIARPYIYTELWRGLRARAGQARPGGEPAPGGAAGNLPAALCDSSYD
ncbi:MAG: glycosyltransferase family 2 protein [Acidobacteriota bacterium]|nr:glycosyltransferase family 2 protein [Acidobacteriota bacterium]